MSDVEIRRNEIIELLYTYKKYSIDDWEHEGVLQLATSRTANTPPGKTVSPIIYSEQLPLNRLLLDWADQKHSLSVRKITRADYLEWMLQWPPRLP